MRQVVSFVVLSGQSLSNTVTLPDDADFRSAALAGVECPAAVTSATLTLEYSRDESTWYAVFPAGAADALTIGADDANDVRRFVPVTPANYFALGRYVRLRTASAEGADREFNLVFNAVV